MIGFLVELVLFHTCVTYIKCPVAVAENVVRNVDGFAAAVIIIIDIIAFDVSLIGAERKEDRR